MYAKPNVLLVGGEGADAAELEAILRKHANLFRADPPQDLKKILEQDWYDAAFCEWAVRNTVLLQVREKCSHLPVVVFYRTGGEREWVEVLQAGGFDLLVPPYREKTVLATLEQAVASHQASRDRILSRSDRAWPGAGGASLTNPLAGQWWIPEIGRQQDPLSRTGSAKAHTS
ncbi:MAG TPA: response regulator [Terriglobia bacterium]|nr:response regulator [Terriglobia bacterium]